VTEATQASEAAGSMFRGWVWSDRQLVGRPEHGAEVGKILRQQPGTIAVTELRRSHAERLGADDALGLDRWAIEDLGSDRERPRLDVVGDSIVVLSGTVALDPQTMEVVKRPLGLLVTSRLLAVVEDDDEFGRLSRVLEAACPTLSDNGTAGVLHAVLAEVVSGYTEALTALESKADQLAEALFDHRPLDRGQQLEAFRLRRALAELLRVIQPMQDVTTTLAQAAAHAAQEGVADDDVVARLIPARTARRFADVADHVAHAADFANSQRDVLASLYDTSLSLADVRLNMIMKKLSAWAAIIAVPTLITGFMGMNVPYPGNGTPAGVIAAIAVMIAAVLTLFVLFKRNDWL